MMEESSPGSRSMSQQLRQQRSNRQGPCDNAHLDSDNVLTSATTSFRFSRARFRGIHPGINYLGGAGLLPCQCVVPLAYPAVPARSVEHPLWLWRSLHGMLVEESLIGQDAQWSANHSHVGSPKEPWESLLGEIRLDACERDKGGSMIFARSGRSRCATKPDNTAARPYAIARPRLADRSHSSARYASLFAFDGSDTAHWPSTRPEPATRLGSWKNIHDENT